MPKIIKTLLQKNSTAEQIEESVYKQLNNVARIAMIISLVCLLWVGFINESNTNPLIVISILFIFMGGMYLSATLQDFHDLIYNYEKFIQQKSRQKQMKQNCILNRVKQCFNM